MTSSKPPSGIEASAEFIAYQLLMYTLQIEAKNAEAAGTTHKTSRNYVLDAYTDCLEAVKGKRERRVIAR